MTSNLRLISVPTPDKFVVVKAPRIKWPALPVFGETVIALLNVPDVLKAGDAGVKTDAL